MKTGISLRQANHFLGGSCFCFARAGCPLCSPCSCHFLSSCAHSPHHSLFSRSLRRYLGDDLGGLRLRNVLGENDAPSLQKLPLPLGSRLAGSFHAPFFCDLVCSSVFPQLLKDDLRLPGRVFPLFAGILKSADKHLLTPRCASQPLIKIHPRLNFLSSYERGHRK